jgi:hypothetical protein
MSAVVITGDTSGTVTLQAPAVAGTTTLTLPATNGTIVTTASGQSLASPAITGTATLNGVNMSPYTMRNRVINGDMRIDQRNAGASVTPTTGQYTVDRMKFYLSQASKLTAQQNAGSVTPPAGFTNYLGITSSSAYTVASGDYFILSHLIEGYNMSDFAWGTANAKTVTLSFWVRSSLTGTFGGSIRNADSNRSYVFSYVISAANTWEYKTVSITGDTSGTWYTNNGIGIELGFGLGIGSTYTTSTTSSWVAGNYVAPTGATSVVGTNGATWYVTGVQLEVGSAATSFEWRPFTTELQLCQRYYFKVSQTGTGPYGFGYNWGSTGAQWGVYFPTTMRSNPTFTSSAANTFLNQWSGGNTTPSGISLQESTNSLASINFDASGLGAGQGMKCIGNGSFASFIAFSAEL